jgi:heptaprenyl diphosphate synthase
MSLYGYRDSDSEFVDRTLHWMNRLFDHVNAEINDCDDHELIARLRDHFVPGKMLRTRLARALWEGNSSNREEIYKACAATELIHSATLFHDDVIDGASLRRGHPSLWKEVGETGAILMGDLFFSSSLQLIMDSGHINRVRSFIDKVREVCATEMVHELVYSGVEIDVSTCIKVARGKTGPLFAFVAECCGGDDREKAHALCEAGYHLGTAYQIADDLLDESGDEDMIGKTLGTDRKRRKFTLAQDKDFSKTIIRNQINSLCDNAVALLWPWPELLPRLEHYIVSELIPFLDIQLENVEPVSAYEVG